MEGGGGCVLCSLLEVYLPVGSMLLAVMGWVLTVGSIAEMAGGWGYVRCLSPPWTRTNKLQEPHNAGRDILYHPRPWVRPLSPASQFFFSPSRSLPSPTQPILTLTLTQPVSHRRLPPHILRTRHLLPRDGRPSEARPRRRREGPGHRGRRRLRGECQGVISTLPF